MSKNMWTRLAIHCAAVISDISQQRQPTMAQEKVNCLMSTLINLANSNPMVLWENVFLQLLILLTFVQH